MLLLEETEEYTRIYRQLYRLGVTANYVGFFYVSQAVFLSLRQPERLLLVTKWLYPDVAAHYGARADAVERGMRTVVAAVWRENRERLQALAGEPLERKPTVSRFLRILTGSFEEGGGERREAAMKEGGNI